MPGIQPFIPAVNNEMSAGQGNSQLARPYAKSFSEAVPKICMVHDEMPMASQGIESNSEDDSHERKPCYQAGSKSKTINHTELLHHCARCSQNNEMDYGDPDYGDPYLCASNLPVGLTVKKVKRHFKSDKFVELDEPNGSAILYYKTMESAIKALRFNGSIWRKHLIRLDWHGNYPGMTILVTGFDTSVKVKKIRRSLADHFSSCGNIKRLSVLTYRNPIIPEKKAGDATGKAFMEFETWESLIKGILLDQSEMNGFKLKVEVAKPKPVRSQKAKPSLWQGKRTILDVETTLDDLWEGKRTIYYDSDV